MLMESKKTRMVWDSPMMGDSWARDRFMEYGRKPKWKNIREISPEEVKPMSKPVPAESRLGWTRGEDVTALPKRKALS